MRFLVWFLSSAIFVLTVCATRISLEAAEEFQILSSIDNLESHLSKLEDPLAESGEAVTKIISFLDEKQASSFYLNSKLSGKTAVENDKLCEDIEAFKDEFLKEPSLTKEGRLGISRQLIQALVNLGKNKEALELCKDFSDRYPESKTDIIRLYYLTGVSFQELSRYDQAIESYQQALLYSDKGGFTNHIHINLGWCYYTKGRYEKAIDEYTRTLQEGLLDPGTIQWVWFETGRCHFFLKNYEDATKAFQRVLNINPETKLARQAKANIEDIERFKKGGPS